MMESDPYGNYDSIGLGTYVIFDEDHEIPNDLREETSKTQESKKDLEI